MGEGKGGGEVGVAIGTQAYPADSKFIFAPVGWHLCDGTLLPIAQNQALFSLLGTTYGGDG